MVERERMEMFQVPVVVEEDNQVQIQQIVFIGLHPVVVVQMEPYIYGLKYIHHCSKMDAIGIHYYKNRQLFGVELMVIVLTLAEPHSMDHL